MATPPECRPLGDKRTPPPPPPPPHPPPPTLHTPATACPGFGASEAPRRTPRPPSGSAPPPPSSGGPGPFSRPERRQANDSAWLLCQGNGHIWLLTKPEFQNGTLVSGNMQNLRNPSCSIFEPQPYEEFKAASTRTLDNATRYAYHANKADKLRTAQVMLHLWRKLL